LAQNGYTIDHFVLDVKKEDKKIINKIYQRYELPLSTGNKLAKYLNSDYTIIVINDFEIFKKYTNLDELRKSKCKSIIMNQKFEVFVPNLNKYYSIINDKDILAFSGILASLRPHHEYTPPFIPKVNLFVTLFTLFYLIINQLF
jgi:hypothetical protein